MRNVLLGTTALVAAGMLAGSGAPAQGAEPIQLSLGGYFRAYFVVRAQSDVDNEGPGASESTVGNDEDIRHTDVLTDGEVFFTGSTTLDNGITVGVNIQLEAATTGDQIDEHFLFFSGNFGRLVVGAENSAPYLMHYGAPNVDAIGTDDPTFFSIAATAGNAVGDNSATTTSYATNDANKITYFTPRFSPGFQFGFSYTPEEDNDVSRGGRQGDAPSDSEDDGDENWLSFGVNLVRAFGDVDFAASLGYEHGFHEGNGTEGDSCDGSSGEINGLCIVDPDEREGHDVVFTGFNIGVSGWTIGGGFKWSDAGEERENDTIDAALAVNYGAGPWLVGAGASYNTDEDGGGDNDTDKVVAAHVAGAYTLGPGVKVVAGVQGSRGWGDDGNENFDGVVFSVGSSLSF